MAGRGNGRPPSNGCGGGGPRRRITDNGPVGATVTYLMSPIRIYALFTATISGFTMPRRRILLILRRPRRTRSLDAKYSRLAVYANNKIADFGFITGL